MKLSKILLVAGILSLSGCSAIQTEIDKIKDANEIFFEKKKTVVVEKERPRDYGLENFPLRIVMFEGNDDWIDDFGLFMEGGEFGYISARAGGIKYYDQICAPGESPLQMKNYPRRIARFMKNDDEVPDFRFFMPGGRHFDYISTEEIKVSYEKDGEDKDKFPKFLIDDRNFDGFADYTVFMPDGKKVEYISKDDEEGRRVIYDRVVE